MRNRWINETVAVLASGPSLTQSDATYAREHAARVITVNETWRLCPTADVAYGADAGWWRKRGPTPEQFRGQLWTQRIGWRKRDVPEYMNVAENVKTGHQVTRNGPIALGANSSFQAMALAIHWGAAKVVFLGLDMTNDRRKSHWHGDHPEGLRNTSDATFRTFRRNFEKAAPILQQIGVTVINASSNSALTCFEQKRLYNALP